MIEFTPDTAKYIRYIYRFGFGTEDGGIRHILDIASRFNTCYTDQELSKNLSYWAFLHACLNNLKTGIWNILPNMWAEYVSTPDINPLTDKQICDERDRYLAHRKEVLNELGLSVMERNDREVILNWIRRPKGEQNLLNIADTLVKINLSIRKIDLNGIAIIEKIKPSLGDNSYTPSKNFIGNNKAEILHNILSN
jgi:hypothetical protein